MTPETKKTVQRISNEIGEVIFAYLDDPCDFNLERMHTYFEDLLIVIKGIQKKRNVDAEGENKKP